MKNIYILPTEEPSRLHYSKIKSNDQISYKLVLKKELKRVKPFLKPIKNSEKEFKGRETEEIIWLVSPTVTRRSLINFMK